MFAGVILCGGHSSRMGHPKALLPFDDRPLLLRTLDTVSVVCSPIVISSSFGQDLPPIPPHIRVVADPVASEGPLRGILTALEALPPECAGAFVCSCDLPFLTVEAIRLIAGLGDAERAIVPRIDGRVQPLTAWYPRSATAVMRRMLDAGERRLRELLDRLETTYLDGEVFRPISPDLRVFCNLNTPEEYRRALGGR